MSISACTVVFICIKKYCNKYKKKGVNPKKFYNFAIFNPGEPDYYKTENRSKL